MIISVDPGDRKPPYQQIRIQILTAVTEGSSAPGTRLPTVRQLAADLGLAVNTVARAYRELERDGAIETRGRKGTFVGDRSAIEPATTQAHRLDSIAEACVAEARRLGASATDIARAMARALASDPT